MVSRRRRNIQWHTAVVVRHAAVLLRVPVVALLLVVAADLSLFDGRALVEWLRDLADALEAALNGS